MLTSTNPVLADASLEGALSHSHADASGRTATVQGVVNKTIGCVVLATIAGAGGYALAAAYPGWSSAVMIGSLIATLIVFFTLARTPERCQIGAPLYAALEGVALGTLTFWLESILVSRGITTTGMGSLTLQAFVITASLMLAMLGAYKAGILKPTERFASFLTVATLGIVIIYGISFILSIFDVQMPFITLGSALEGGNAALIGLGINVLVLIVGALWFVMDFGQIQRAVESGAPASWEWFLTFGLLVSIAWVYIEALKLAFRLALLFGGRRD